MNTETIYKALEGIVGREKLTLVKGELITDYKAMHESQTYKNIFKGFVNNDQKHREEDIADRFISDWKAYIVGEDIYEVYRLREGFSVLQKISLNSCISNNSFDEVYCCEDGFVKSEQHYKNCRQNRRIFSQRKLTVTTESL